MTLFSAADTLDREPSATAAPESSTEAPKSNMPERS